MIAPPEYVPRRIGYSLDSINIQIPEPIEQIVSGEQGIYRLTPNKMDPMSARDFYELSLTERYMTPTHTDHDDLERMYWDTINENTPIYGSDVDGTLTDADVTSWNVNNLGTMLDYVREDYGTDIRGVLKSMLYFGMWKASFAWHTEDMDLYSINYLHSGAPKIWYAIPPAHGNEFEALANRLFPEDSESCYAHLRHKMAAISPDVLQKNQIPFVKTAQEAGEFIITFPFGYHAGFNAGFNLAESSNFGSERWIEYGKHANLCRCGRCVFDQFISFVCSLYLIIF